MTETSPVLKLFSTLSILLNFSKASFFYIKNKFSKYLTGFRKNRNTQSSV